MPITVPAAVRTMTLFEVFARERRELSNKEIADLLSLPESSTSDLLFTLHQMGYLTRTAKTRRFFPSSRLDALVPAIDKDDRLSAVAEEAVEALRNKTQESSFFGRLDHGAVRVLAVQEGTHALRYVLNVGERIALHASAMGKAILSLLPADEVRRHLKAKPLRQVTSKTVIDPAALEKEIESYRDTRIASVKGEGSEGATAYAIAGMIGLEHVALSCAGASERFGAMSERYLDALREVAATVFVQGDAQS